MIIIKLQGGLGNQMFQYAYAKALALRTHQGVFLDLSEYKTYFRPFELEIFDISTVYAKKNQVPWYMWLKTSNRYVGYFLFKLQWICKVLNPNHVRETHLQFDKKLLNISHGYVEGYFQSEKYFSDYVDEIRKDFIFVTDPSSQNKYMIDMIQSSQSVSVHIRRGDYLKGNNLQYHGVCSLEYYKSAIQIIKDNVSHPRFFFFSDDIAWVKENIQTGNSDDVYVDHNTGEQSREDMRLMSVCKHNIIANSSFSWRGAWLNRNPEKIVIAPSTWFTTKELDYTNVVPESRRRI